MMDAAKISQVYICYTALHYLLSRTQVKTIILSRLPVHLLFLLTMFVSAQNQLLETIPEINYEKFQLDNGLTVVVHQDKKVPMVAVNVWYHVGSKNEKVGKTGFAHLFEHLMFNGTENYNSEYFEPFEQVMVKIHCQILYLAKINIRIRHKK